jgi:hypothetical protein
MKKVIYIFLLISTIACLNNSTDSKGKIEKALISEINIDPTIRLLKKEKLANKNKPLDNLSLHFSYAGLGSQMGSKQPVFRVYGLDFIYTLEQNSSWSGEFNLEIDTICTGRVRVASMDSIYHLAQGVKDTLVYKTDPHIMSGGMHHISIKKDSINLTFRLHNASDSIAQIIVELLNSNIHCSDRKLWLFPSKNFKE